jgi:hypothetical protein
MVLPSWPAAKEVISEGLITTLKALLGVSTVLHIILPAFAGEGSKADRSARSINTGTAHNHRECFGRRFRVDIS